MMTNIQVTIVGAGFAGLTAGRELYNFDISVTGLESQPAGGLFFGGEHTVEDSGTMQGAVANSTSAARQKCEVFL